MSNSLRFLYRWAFDLLNHFDYHREVELANITLMIWKKNVRVIYAKRFLQQQPITGGLGHIVEINESPVLRKKYNFGHFIFEQWVFGGYNNTDIIGFVFQLSRAIDKNLLPINEQYIRQNTEIHSYLWLAYDRIQSLPEHYNHLQVNYSLHLVDSDTQACTNHVGNIWKKAKISHNARCGTEKSLYHRICQNNAIRAGAKI